MPPPPTAATESLRVNFWKGKRLYLCIYFDLFFFWRIDDRMGLDGERQKQHRHSGRVGARPDQFDGRRHSAGTLQHFTCPLFHRWVDFVFFFIWVWSFLTLTFGGQETTAASGCWKVLTPRWWRCSSPTMTSPSWLPSGRSRSTSAPSSPYRRDSPGESVQLTPCPILLLFPPSGVAIPPYSSRLWRLYFEQRPIKVTITIYGARAQAGTTRIDWIASLTAYHSLP